MYVIYTHSKPKTRKPNSLQVNGIRGNSAKMLDALKKDGALELVVGQPRSTRHLWCKRAVYSHKLAWKGKSAACKTTVLCTSLLVFM